MEQNLPAKTQEPLSPILSNTAYDKLKFLAQIVLPALGALYFGLAAIWGLPEADRVVGTITVVDAFLGVFLGLSSKVYKAIPPPPPPPIVVDGNIEIVEHDTSLVHQLEIMTPPEEMANKKTITLRVLKKPLQPYEGEFPEDKFA